MKLCITLGLSLSAKSRSTKRTASQSHTCARIHPRLSRQQSRPPGKRPKSRGNSFPCRAMRKGTLTSF